MSDSRLSVSPSALVDNDIHNHCHDHVSNFASSNLNLRFLSLFCRFLALDREEDSQWFSALNWLVLSFNHTFSTVDWSSLVNLTAGSFCGFAISDVDNSNDKETLESWLHAVGLLHTKFIYTYLLKNLRI